jgi:dephospho-CoA kinase
MIRLGLTGSIGMGKSATARMFAEEGVPVFDADAEVHRLYAADGAGVEAVGGAFPGVIVDGAVDRKRLAQVVGGDPEALKRLEAIVHPLVGQARARFLSGAEAGGAQVAVLDIPLLFETGREGDVDAVVVVSAPAHVQRERVLSRPEMTEARFAALHTRQMPDAEKRARADFVIDTSHGFDAARAQVRQVLATLGNPQWKPKAKLDPGHEPPH